MESGDLWARFSVGTRVVTLKQRQTSWRSIRSVRCRYETKLLYGNDPVGRQDQQRSIIRYRSRKKHDDISGQKFLLLFQLSSATAAMTVISASLSGLIASNRWLFHSSLLLQCSLTASRKHLDLSEAPSLCICPASSRRLNAAQRASTRVIHSQMTSFSCLPTRVSWSSTVIPVDKLEFGEMHQASKPYPFLPSL
jgi:hypothetical protein